MVLRTLKIAIVVGSMLTATGCMQRSTSEYPTGQNPGSQNGQGYDKQGEFTGGDKNSTSTGTGQVPVKFDSASLATAAAEIDLSKEITFRLEFLDYDKSQATKVENGKVDITFKDLPTDKAGTLTLSILNDEKVVVFKGTKETTLKAGPNNIDIILRKVDPDTGKTTDVTLSVTLEDGAATKPDATKPDATKPDATKPDATKPDATKPDDTVKPDDAIKDWDGESFKGNDKWEIKPVD